MRRLAGVLAVLALATAGCGGTTAIGTGASDLIPASAAAYVAVDTDPESSQWQTVDALASKFPDKQKGIDELKRELRKEDGVDWDKDIKPALGAELDFAWLDFGNDGENFVMLTQPKDEAKFKQLIEKGNKSDPDDEVVYEKFRGWHVLALKQATIDRFKEASDSATRTLSDESAFTESMDRLGGDAIVRAYVSGKVITDLVRRYGGPEVRPYINKAGKLDWIAARLGANSEGVGLDAIVHGTPGELFKGLPRTEPFEAELPSKVPQNAFVYFTFHGTKNMFSGLQKNPVFKTPELRPFAGILEEIGRVLAGENALYVRPGSGRVPDVPFNIPEVTFVATGDGSDGAAILDRLLERELELVVPTTRIAGTRVRKLADEGIGLYYANLDGRLVVTDLPSGIRGMKNAGKPLSGSGTYREALDSSGMPDKTHGFVFVNLRSTIPLVEKLSQERIPAEVSRNLKPLRSAVEYAISRSHEIQITFFLQIK